MNYDDYKIICNSMFIAKASNYMDIQNKLPKVRSNKEAAQFDTTEPTKIRLNRLLRDSGYPPRNHDSPNIWPSLYYNLIASTLPLHIKKSIASQWIEVTDIMSQIKSIPVTSFMICMRSGSGIGIHTHTPNTKQILTFEFDFPDIVEPDIEALNKDSYVKIYDESLKPIHYLESGITNKKVFTILDDVKHDTYCKSFKFYWIHDFDEYVNLDGVDFGDFEFLNFISV